MFSSRSKAPSFSNHCGCTKWCSVASGSIPRLRNNRKQQDYYPFISFIHNNDYML